jgi:hypothetical protein
MPVSRKQYLLPINYICILHSYKFKYMNINFFLCLMRRFCEKLITTFNLCYTMKQQCLPDYLNKSRMCQTVKKQIWLHLEMHIKDASFCNKILHDYITTSTTVCNEYSSKLHKSLQINRSEVTCIPLWLIFITNLNYNLYDWNYSYSPSCIETWCEECQTDIPPSQQSYSCQKIPK